MQGWFLGLTAIGNQAGEETDDEIDRASMAGMLDLEDGLELIVDGLDDGAFAKQNDVGMREQAALHVSAQERDQVQTQGVHQMSGQFLADVALVAIELAKEVLG